MPTDTTPKMPGSPEAILRAALEEIAKDESSGYGFFCGGDPRKFYPDAESCSPQELADHKEACEAFDKADAEQKASSPLSCESGWISPNIHITKSKFGIGSYTYPSHTADIAIQALAKAAALAAAGGANG